jgi:hypothetical protein
MDVGSTAAARRGIGLPVAVGVPKQRNEPQTSGWVNRMGRMGRMEFTMTFDGFILPIIPILFLFSNSPSG